MHLHRIFSRTFSATLILGFLVGFFAIAAAPAARAQSRRVNDRDMEALMRNLRHDARAFRPEFDSAMNKSILHKTSQAKDAKNQAAALVRQTDTLVDRFKKTRNAQSDFEDVMSIAAQLDRTIHTARLHGRVLDRWHRIRAELHQIADGYGIPDQLAEPGMNGMAMNGGDSASCLQTAGRVKANGLVNECLQVSPATHPPCNAENSCALIVSEIKRSCALIGHGAPAFCAQFS